MDRSRAALAGRDRSGAHIHPSAVVAPEALIGDGVRIGPYCVVGPDAALADGVRLHSHVVVDGHTLIGERTEVRAFACVGARPQDLKYADEPSRLTLGRDCRVFEHAHICGGTAAAGATAAAGGGALTVLGDGCFIMSHVHVGHDCRLGRRQVSRPHFPPTCHQPILSHRSPP